MLRKWAENIVHPSRTSAILLCSIAATFFLNKSVNSGNNLINFAYILAHVLHSSEILVFLKFQKRTVH